MDFLQLNQQSQNIYLNIIKMVLCENEKACKVRIDL